MNLDKELEVASDVARKASEAILEVYRADFQVDFKGKDDPVTEADRRANDLIVATLRKAFPNDVAVGEESDHSAAEWIGKSRVWYIDPVDGTKEFVEKNGQFAIHIGLAVEGKATLGVVFQPTTGNLYSGIVGEGAWIEANGARRPARVSTRETQEMSALVHSRSHGTEALIAMKSALKFRKMFGHGSVGLKISKILEQEADAYIETTVHTKAWDSCAPEAILKAAGGRFTDLLGNEIQYATRELRNLHGLAATNGLLHESVLGIVRPMTKNFGL